VPDPALPPDDGAQTVDPAWLEALRRRPPALYGVAMALVAGIAYADFLTGDEILLYAL